MNSNHSKNISGGLLLAFCISLFFIHGVYAQPLHRKHMALPPGEMWGTTTHRVTADSGTISLFESFDNTSNYYLHLVKTSANGAIEWSTRWASDGESAFNEIGIAPDSGFIVCYTGFAPSPVYYIVRFDAGGNMIYSKKINVPSPYSIMRSAPEIIAKANGNCYILGFLKDMGVPFPYKHVLHVFELDNAGTVLWSRAYNEDYNVIKTLRIGADTCANGDLVIMGYHYNNATSQVCPRITRLTPTGSLVWSKYYTVSGMSNMPISLVVVPGDEIVVASEANSASALLNLMRCDGQGNVLWNYEFTSSPSAFHIGGSNGKLMEGENNTTVLWGFSPGTGLMIKNDFTGAVVCQASYPNLWMRSSGDLLGTQRYSAIASDLTSASIVYFTTDLCGQTCSNSNFAATKTPLTTSVISERSDTLMPVIDLAIVLPPLPVSFSLQEICTDVVGYAEPLTGTVAVYPVPANNVLRIESATPLERAELIDVQGRVAFVKELQGTRSASVALPQLANGIYLLRVTDAEGKSTQQKILIEQDQ
jgi:hypothetical protein